MSITRTQFNKSGLTFKVISNDAMWFKFEVGDILVKQQDDGTASPMFRRLSDGETGYWSLEDLEVVSSTNVGLSKALFNTEGLMFRVIGRPTTYFRPGDILIKECDDGSDCPRFRCVANGKTGFYNLEDLELVRGYHVTPAKPPSPAAPPVTGITREQFNKTGARFRVTNPAGSDYLVGDILVKYVDDNSDSPQFRRLSDNRKQYLRLTGVVLSDELVAARPSRPVPGFAIFKGTVGTKGAPLYVRVADIISFETLNTGEVALTMRGGDTAYEVTDSLEEVVALVAAARNT